jgi:glucosamine--fructose-6-phosphate aminotransferase (isomerizing)
MTYHLYSLGVPALCMEATDLLHFGRPLLRTYPTLIFVSQSGASAEVPPIVASLPTETPLLAITNQPDSLLARRARIVLPIVAGIEEWVATKTYVNSIALLWILARKLSGGADGREWDTLRFLTDACDHLIAQETAITVRWLDSLEARDSLVFVGHGPDSVTARHTAMMFSEWCKLPAFGASAGTLRHGYIEQVKPGSAVVCFASNTTTFALMRDLAQELAGYGARVLIVNGGQVRALEEVPAFPVDPFLAPILDVIPAQLAVHALAQKLGIPPGFRYIAKVVSKL